MQSTATQGFLPHGYCFLWDRPLMWTHVVSDVLIGLSYLTISLSLAWLVHRVRREIPFGAAFVAFGLFIVTCGMTHVLEVVTFWHPIYRVLGAVKVVTAVASVSTAIAMPFVVPRVRATVLDAGRARAREVQAARAAALEEANDELARANATMARALEDAESSRARERLILASLPDVTMAFDSRWRYTYVNPAATALLREAGLDPSRVLGKNAFDVMPQLRGSTFERRAMEAVRDRQVVQYEDRSAVMGERWFENRIVPTPDGAVLVSRDVTERRRVVEAERAAREAAEAASRAKSEFLATMSHELRTPLNAIGGYVQLLEMGLRGPITAEQRDDLSRIGRSQRHLLALINDVLDFAKVEGGSVAYEAVPVPIDRVLADVEALVTPQLALKQLTFANGDARCGAVALADRARVEQILLNLLSNAVKFTPAGGRVEVTCGAEADAVVVRVQDTGIGIPADKLEDIFHPFVQVSSGFTRTAEGTGLGLAISRDLARGMGGELTAESAPGSGATFTLRLPAHAAPRVAAE